MTDSSLHEDVKSLRRHLHRLPDLSGDEEGTSTIIQEFLGSHPARKIIGPLGGHGFLLDYDSGVSGPTILLRADIDGLPIQEENPSLSYASARNGRAHLCGHDGHSSILAGVARKLDSEGITKGRVLLLFQPSEEDGRGAHAVLNDEKFDYQPDFVLALHNLPGYPMNSVIWREGPFAYASTGMKIRLSGRTSHAAEPQNGISPERAILKILSNISGYRNTLPEGVIVTTTHIQLGEKAFGISPGQADLYFTLRAPETELMEEVYQEMEKRIEGIASDEQLRFMAERTEFFPSTKNHPAAVEILREAAVQAGLRSYELESPFRWSEDFGWFTGAYPGVLFGLGSGKEQVPLHHPSYDFPDELLPAGIKIFMEIIRACQGLQ